MKLRMPEYYKNFKCIANKCKDNCCSTGWKIDIDNDTMNKYNSIDGKFRDKLRKNISSSNNSCHFILNTDNACPFLKNGLCEIYAELGKQNLCKICVEHPRYYEWFKEIKEGGIGLCCEEAARIIISNTKKFKTFDINIENEEFDQYDEELFTYLQNTRKKIINYLENESISLNTRIKNIIWYGNIIQQNIDFNLLDDDNIVDVSSSFKNKRSNISEIFDFLHTLEFNDKNWIPYIKKCAKKCYSDIYRFHEFEVKFPEVNTYLKNISIYFIWRYYIKGCFDSDVLSKIKLMGLGVYVIRYLLFFDWLQYGSINLDSCIKIAKKFSEEIEYSENNLLKFSEASYELPCFSVEKFIDLFY